MTDKPKIVYCNPPIKTNIYDFMNEHPNCNFAIKDRGDIKTSNVEVVAYVTSPKYDNLLDQQFGGKAAYEIIVGADFSPNTLNYPY